MKNKKHPKLRRFKQSSPPLHATRKRCKRKKTAKMKKKTINSVPGTKKNCKEKMKKNLFRKSIILNSKMQSSRIKITIKESNGLTSKRI